MYQSIFYLYLHIIVPFYLNRASFTDLTLGTSTTIRCVDLFSLVGINIQWTDSDKNFFSNNNVLIIPNVKPSLHNTQYTCTVTIYNNPLGCAHESKTIVITTRSM